MDGPIMPRAEPLPAHRTPLRSYMSGELIARITELEEENLKLLRALYRLLRENKRLRGTF